MMHDILSHVLTTPWAILPAKLAEILQALGRQMFGGDAGGDGLVAIAGASPRPAQRQAGAIAVIPLMGTIWQRAGLACAFCGGTSLDGFRSQFRQALADPGVGAVVIQVDSPGGTVPGVAELSAEIYHARGRKPIVAVADSLAASAAYWVASAAGEMVATPSAEVGGIGVFAAHEDWSRAFERFGIKTTLIWAGKYKVEANPYEPLSDEARAAIQERVDAYYGMFVAAVARNRGVREDEVRSGFGEGRVVGAERARALGMVDRVETMDQVLDRLAKQMRATGGAKAGGAAAAQPFTAGAIPPHKSPAIADEDAEWDASEELARAEGREQLRRMHAWVDEDGDPDAKSSYKLPHHRADGTLVPRGVYAAAQRLDAVDIPEEDKPGVRQHLEAHYQEMGKTAPWGRTAAGLEFRRRRLRLAVRMS